MGTRPFHAVLQLLLGLHRKRSRPKCLPPFWSKRFFQAPNPLKEALSRPKHILGARQLQCPKMDDLTAGQQPKVRENGPKCGKSAGKVRENDPKVREFGGGWGGAHYELTKLWGGDSGWLEQGFALNLGGKGASKSKSTHFPRVRSNICLSCLTGQNVSKTSCNCSLTRVLADTQHFSTHRRVMMRWVFDCTVNSTFLLESNNDFKYNTRAHTQLSNYFREGPRLSGGRWGRERGGRLTSHVSGTDLFLSHSRLQLRPQALIIIIISAGLASWAQVLLRHSKGHRQRLLQ